MTFSEQLIKTKKTPGQIIRLILMWFAALAISALVLYLALGATSSTGYAGYFMFAVLGVCGLCWFSYWLTNFFYIEYEYHIFEGELDIDKIIGKRKRKRVVQVSSKKIEQLAPIEAFNMTEQFDRIVVASETRASATFFVTYRSKKNGHTVVFFSPVKEIFDELYEGQQRSVQTACKELCEQYKIQF